MAEISTVMGVDAGDIASIMGVEAGDVSTFMGVELVTSTSYMGNRAVQMGGGYGNYGGTATLKIHYKSLSSNGDTAEFGEIDPNSTWLQSTWRAGRTKGSVVGNDTRAVIMGGEYMVWAGYWSGGWLLMSWLEYITIANTGDASDYGDLAYTSYRASCGHGSGNGIRGLLMGGFASTGVVNNIDYITVANLGNSSDFGDCTAAVSDTAGNANNTRGIWWMSRTSSYWNQKNADYVTFASTGNAADFGDYSDLINAPTPIGMIESRNVWSGGSNSNPQNFWDNIEYLNPSSLGDTSDFGDLQGAGAYAAGHFTNGTRGEKWGGQTNDYGASTDDIEYITIATTGNATDSTGDIGTGAGNIHSAGWSGD